MAEIVAPWDKAQVDCLNAYQQSDLMHPFTCGADPCRAVLLATADGWICPECGEWKQNWAHDFMVNRLWSNRNG